jgi:putative nucleotidyltransferase with HDIG domain
MGTGELVRDGTDQLVHDVGAIAQLENSTLQDAVIRTWTAALDQGGYRHLGEVPQSAGVRGRPLLDHVNEVNDLVLYLLRLAETRFALKPDRDVTLAGAILHDVDKAFIQRLMPSGSVQYVDGYTVRDHGPAGASLAATCGVPEKVCDLIRTHAPFNYDGHLPATVEGTIIHYADLVAFDLAANQVGSIPIHARSLILKKDHPLLRQVDRIESY